MNKDIELKLSSLLREDATPKEICQYLCECFHSPAQELFKEKKYYLSALIYMGFYKEALSLITHEVVGSQEFPWKHFLFLLWRLHITPSEDCLKSVCEGAEEQGQTDELGTIRAWDTWDPRFQRFHLDGIEKRKMAYQENINDLKDRAHFYRSQRLYGEEKKLLKKLLSLCPDSEKIQSQLQEVEELWSLDVISKAPLHEISPAVDIGRWLKESPQETLESSSDLGRESLIPPLDFSKKISSKDCREVESEAQAQVLLQFIKEKEICRENPTLLYNLALFFKMTENPHFCLKLLEGAKGFSIDWLRIEALIDAEQYLLVLDEISFLEGKYYDKPETSFASLYAKAIAFQHLGQNSMAIELMEKIIRVKPHYRSAHEYLKDWREQ